MGQKTQPIGFRLGINRTWDSRWFGGKSYADLLHKDIEVRKFLFEKLKAAAGPADSSPWQVPPQAKGRFSMLTSKLKPPSAPSSNKMTV